MSMAGLAAALVEGNHIPVTLIHSTGSVPIRGRGCEYTEPTCYDRSEGIEPSFTALAAPPPYTPSRRPDAARC